jgi:hypothetical protein
MVDEKNKQRQLEKEEGQKEIEKLEKILKEKAASYPCGFRY